MRTQSPFGAAGTGAGMSAGTPSAPTRSMVVSACATASTAEAGGSSEMNRTQSFVAMKCAVLGWLATMFPPQVKFIGVDTGFPESPAWRQRMRQAVAERSGPHYVMLGAVKNEKLDTLRNKLAAAQWLGLTDDAAGCAKLDWLGRVVRLQVELRRLPSGGCTFELPPRQRDIDLAAPNRAIVDAAAQHLQRFGITLDSASCKVYPAALARKTYMYQLCRAIPAMTSN